MKDAEERHPLTPRVNQTPFSIEVGITNHKDGQMRLVEYHGDYKANQNFPNETRRLVIESAIDELRDCIKELGKLYNDCVPKV